MTAKRTKQMQEASARKTKVKVKVKVKAKTKAKGNRCRDETVKASVDSVEALIEVAETRVVLIRTMKIGTVTTEVAVLKTIEIGAATPKVEAKEATNKELKAQALQGLQALKRNPIPAILHKKSATFFRISPPSRFNPLVDLRVKKSVPARELPPMAQTEARAMARDKGLEATRDRFRIQG